MDIVGQIYKPCGIRRFCYDAKRRRSVELRYPRILESQVREEMQLVLGADRKRHMGRVDRAFRHDI